jgi:hypothetical protein
MKKILIIAVVALGALASCDKVENPYPVAEQTDLDYTLYPGGGDSTSYVSEWPTFTANTNTQRNVVIEDFTGHKCTYCPIAADTAEAIHADYPTRAFVATIHTGPTGDGIGGFQSTSTEFPIDWTNPDGLGIGTYFGGIPGSAFTGNPRGTVSRIQDGGGQHTLHVNDWRLYSENALASQLNVNIQSALNNYPSTRGAFLHTEIDVLDGSTDLYTVVYLIEDSIIGKQKLPDNSTEEFYVHREVMRDCIWSGWQGLELTDDKMDGNGLYHFDYSYELPSQYAADNVHFLIYVRDSNTEEILQVIKQKFI